MPKKTVIFQYQHSWIKESWDKILILVIFAVFFLFYPGQNKYSTAQFEVFQPQKSFRELAVPTPHPYPENVTGIFPDNDVSAEGIIIVDIDSGVYLYKRNEEMRLSPASTTKLLTVLVALDLYKLDDIVTIKTVKNSGQVMGLIPGERISVENLLYGTLIHSGNDAAWSLAEHYSKGPDAFVNRMNEKAKDLHLTQSHFTNPMGYDDPEHKMTSLDLSRLAIVALSNPTIAKMVAIPQITISDVTHTYFHKLSNINQLLGKIPGVGGIKTGWTEEAGENLVTFVERSGRKIIIVVLHSRDRFGDTTKLIDWVFANYKWEDYSLHAGSTAGT